MEWEWAGMRKKLCGKVTGADIVMKNSEDRR
jgi:hypothetical protein